MCGEVVCSVTNENEENNIETLHIEVVIQNR